MAERVRLVDDAGRPLRRPVLRWRRGRPSVLWPDPDGGVLVGDVGDQVWIGGARLRVGSDEVVPVPPPSPALPLLAVALLVRLTALWVLEPSPLVGDEGWYLRQADAARRAGLSWWFDPSARLPFTSAPLVPALGAVAQAALGDGERPLRLVSAVVGAFAAPAAWRVGERLAGRTSGLLAGVVVALHPELVVFGAHLWTEAVFTTLVVGVLLALLTAPPRWWAAGLVLGAAALTREAGLALPLVVAAWWASAPRARLRAAALTLAVCVGVVAPYVARARLDPRITGLMSATSSFNLYVGNVRGGSFEALGDDPRARDAAAAEAAWATIGADPAGWLVTKADLATRRLVSPETTSVLIWTSPPGSDLRARPRWRWMDGEGARAWLAGGSRAVGRTVLLGGIAGLVAALGSRRRGVALVLLSVIVALWLPAVLTVSKPRFLVPALPVLAAGLGFWARGREAWAAPGWVAAGVAAALALWGMGA